VPGPVAMLGGMTTTLITGATKGLGREAARRLIAAGHAVYLGARDPQRGKEVAADLGADLVLIDVTSDDSVQAAAGLVRGQAGHLDVLVNNAGIAGGWKAPGEVTAADMLAVYDTNVFGVVRVMRAFLPLLTGSAAPVVVNVSSGLGSLTVTTDPSRFESTLLGLAYPSAKSALNMLTSQYAKAYPAIKINAVDPGYTATDLNGHRGTQTVEEGAEIIVRMAMIGADGPTGGYFDVAGRVPW
jgi:NAD(P)-dependent dehydrogenase (short-subunit alcohol dehydrogenase family)